MYTNAPFVRPPGPFPSQSTASLERALVRSARLAQSWTTQSLRIMSHVVVPYYGQPPRDIDDVVLVCGRWFTVCQSKRRIVLYDVNRKPKKRVPQVLWETQRRIHRWTSCSVTSEDGNLIIYVMLCEQYSERPKWYVSILSLSPGTSHTPNPDRKFIEFRINGESGLLCDTIPINVPGRGFLGTPDIVGNLKQSPFLFVEPLYMVFDTRTRLLHEFPEFRIAMVRHDEPNIAGCSMAHRSPGRNTVRNTVRDQWQSSLGEAHHVHKHTYSAFLLIMSGRGIIE